MEPCRYPPQDAILSVSGEWERERLSRAWNAWEALLLHTAVLAILWPFAYGLGVYATIPALRPIAIGLLLVVVFFMLVVSPRLHGDAACAWGLGTPKALLQHWRNKGLAGKVLLLSALLPLAGAMLWLNHTRWAEILSFFQIRSGPLPRLPESAAGLVLVWLWGGLLAFGFVSSAIRYDNFLSALSTGLKIALPLCLVVVFAALLHRGPAAFHSKPPEDLLLQAFGYLFWGFLQQLLFSGYYCTRLRRAVPPAPGNRWPRRLAVAALVASCFASIHLISYTLVGATFILGLPLAYVFMNDRNRNLVALSVVHALLGTTVHWLFSTDTTANLVEYRVGPWHVHEGSLEVLIVPGLLMAAYTLAAALFLGSGQRRQWLG